MSASRSVPRKYVIVADSRGRYLLEHIRNCCRVSTESENIPVNVYFFPGAGLRRLASESLKLARDTPEIVLFIFGGVNDFTVKKKHPRDVGVARNLTTDLTDHVIDLFDEMDYKFRLHLPSVNVIYSPVTGIDLARYASRTDHGPEDQNIIDGTVINVNRRVAEINISRGNPTPWTATLVHKRRRGFVKTYYRYLEDGLHPGPELLVFWAKALISTILKLEQT